MTARAAGTRRGAHRSRRDLTSAVVPSLLAVLAVTALVTALYVWRAEDPSPSRVAASTGQPTTQPMTGGSPSPDVTSAPATTTSAPATRTTPRPTAPATTRAAAVVRDIEVVVLNQTSRGGLAARVADVLRGKGWTVPATGNFRGIVPATTVYYPPGAEAQARRAARDLPTEPRLRPRFGNLSTSRLTVVVTDSYPS
jgi:hypothetical protein